VSSRFAIVSILGLLCGGAAQAQPDAGIEVDAEIVLAVDVSRSMDMREFAIQRDGYAAALRHPDLIRAVTAGQLGRIAFSYFEWSGEAQDGTLIPWRIIDGPAAAVAMADEIAASPVQRSRGTSIARALYFAAVLIDDGTVAGARRIIDVSGDGANNVGPPVTGARDAALARGITINGLPIMASAGTMPDLDLYYEDCVVGGEGSFVLVATTGEELARTIRRKLIMEISGTAPEPRIIRADFEPTDCLIGEKLYRQRGWDMMR
jgi:Protein of unknown function (DUF1194)